MGDVNLSISNELVEPILRAKIESAVIAALGADPMQMIEAIVQTALRQKVDSEGKRSDYRDAKPYTTWLAEDMVRKAAMAAVQRWVDGNQAKIEAAIEKQLNRDVSGMAKVLCESFANSVKSKYGWGIKVEVQARERG